MTEVKVGYGQSNSIILDSNFEIHNSNIINFNQVISNYNFNISGLPFQFNGATRYIITDNNEFKIFDPAFNINFDKQKFKELELRKELKQKEDSLKGIKDKDTTSAELKFKPEINANKIPESLKAKKEQLTGTPQNLKDLENFKNNSLNKLALPGEADSNVSGMSKIFKKINNLDLGAFDIPDYNTYKLKTPLSGINLEYDLGIFNLYGSYGVEVPTYYSPSVFDMPKKSVAMAGIGREGLLFNHKMIFITENQGKNSLLLVSSYEVRKVELSIEGEYLQSHSSGIQALDDNYSYSVKLSKNIQKIKSGVKVKSVISKSPAGQLVNAEYSNTNSKNLYEIKLNTRAIKNTSINSDIHYIFYQFTNTNIVQKSYLLNVNHSLNTKININSLCIYNDNVISSYQFQTFHKIFIHQAQFNINTSLFKKRNIFTLSNNYYLSLISGYQTHKDKIAAKNQFKASNKITILNSLSYLIYNSNYAETEITGGVRYSGKRSRTDVNIGYYKNIIYRFSYQHRFNTINFNLKVNNQEYSHPDFLSNQHSTLISTGLIYNF
jgi:hypothetical protein